MTQQRTATFSGQTTVIGTVSIDVDHKDM